MKAALAVALSCYAFGALSGAARAVTIANQYGIEYVKEYETVDPTEAEDYQRMIDDSKQLIAEHYVNKGLRALRSAHPKGHGCVFGKFTVNADLPDAYKIGVFKPGQSYDTIIRFSNALSNPQSDANGDGRGMGIKLFNVPGKKLLDGEEDAQTQDFSLINFPLFPAKSGVDFKDLVRAIVRGSAPKFFLPSIDPRTWHLRQGGTLAGMIKKKSASLLLEHYFSQTPYLFGNRPVKYGVRSCTPDPATPPKTPSPNFLREEMAAYLANHTGCFEFLIQEYKPGFALEDGMGWWPAGLDIKDEPKLLLESISPGIKPVSPFVPVARIELPRQSLDTDAKMTYCDNLSIQPWHSLAEHRPMGGLNRGRRYIYKGISEYRHLMNKSTPYEPASSAEYQALR